MSLVAAVRLQHCLYQTLILSLIDHLYTQIDTVTTQIDTVTTQIDTVTTQIHTDRHRCTHIHKDRCRYTQIHIDTHSESLGTFLHCKKNL